MTFNLHNYSFQPSQLQQRTEYDRGHEFGQFILLPDPENDLGKSKQSSKDPVGARDHEFGRYILIPDLVNDLGKC